MRSDVCVCVATGGERGGKEGRKQGEAKSERRACFLFRWWSLSCLVVVVCGPLAPGFSLPPAPFRLRREGAEGEWPIMPYICVKSVRFGSFRPFFLGLCCSLGLKGRCRRRCVFVVVPDMLSLVSRSLVYLPHKSAPLPLSLPQSKSHSREKTGGGPKMA